MTRLIMLSAVAVSAVTWAQGGPPQEALAACAGKTEGTACTVSFPDGDKAGTCRAGRSGEAIACMPKDMEGRGPGGPGGRGHHGPPPEALAACSGKSSGTTCTVKTPDGDKAGTCRDGPGGEAVACVPNDMPQHHHGPPPQEAITACSGKTDGTTCAFTINSQNITGSCKTGPRGEAAACRPDRMPE